MNTTILATADLHLGKSSSSVDPSRKYSTTGYTWNKMVNYVINHDIDAIVLSGDIVEHENRFFEAAGQLNEGLKKLDDAGVAVVMVAGNHDHDVLPEVMEASRQFEGVHLLGSNGRWSTKTITFKNDQQVQFLGWSFPERHFHSDPLADFSPDLLEPDIPVIGLVHGDYENEDSMYGPLSFATLSQTNVDAWVLGHIHKPGVLQNQSPMVFYPGSPHAMSSKEPNGHGPYLLEVSDGGIISSEHLLFSPVRYENMQVDVEEVQDKSQLRIKLVECIDELTDHLIESGDDSMQHLVLDVELTGYHSSIEKLNRWVDGSELREKEQTRNGISVTVRSIVNNCSFKVSNLKDLADEPSPAGLLASAILDIENDRQSEFLDALKEQISGKITDMNTYGTYRPLSASENIIQYDAHSDEDINQLLVGECHRLLSELMTSKDQ